MNNKLAQALAELEEEATLALVKERLEQGEEPLSILESCREGMIVVGQRYEEGDYFISDLMMAGEIFKRATQILTPQLKAGSGTSSGKVVVGTVKGDIHDIGKDLVVALLRAANFEVLDLGVDVPAQRFVDTVKETGAPVLGLSGLLTISFDGMRDTIAQLEQAGLRSHVKVMIGGGPVTAKICEYTGADGWATDAQSAVTMANRWL